MEDSIKYQGLRRHLVELLKSKGIDSKSVLKAVGNVPRQYFMDQSLINFSYEDQAYPISSNQTISQPFTVAFQTQLLEIETENKILEIGTGSGYQTAILLELSSKIYTIERQQKLYKKTQRLFKSLGLRPKKVIFGSGKIIVDLLSDDGIKNIDSGTEIVSLEQLYPFPIKEIKEILNGAELKEILWVQEEPRNRGAWKYFNENIIEIHENKLKVNYVGRKPSATTATGSSSVHKIQQKRIIDSILK